MEEPLDEMDREPWNADLLDYLAVELVTTDRWDLKKTMARILVSKAYQMPMAALTEMTPDPFVFRGPVVKRLTAEEFVDALAAVTQTSNLKPAFDPTGGAALPHKKAKWIWSTAGAERSAG